MVERMKKSNQMLIALIHDLKKKSFENEAPIWKDIAIRLEKPSKNWSEVNLSRIDKYIRENETALVPGKVLSSGDLTKKVTIAAWSFSKKSLEKIEKSGGKSIFIEELVKLNPKGTNVRILG